MGRTLTRTAIPASREADPPAAPKAQPGLRVQWEETLCAVDESEQLVVHEQQELALEVRRGARDYFERVLQLKPGNQRGHQGSFYALSVLGDAENAELHRRAAFRDRSVVPLPNRGNSTPVSVLLLP